jgi:putative tricarboxylic transport membrane protein
VLLPDKATGLVIAVLGGAAAYAGSRLPPVPGQQVGPSAFPTVVGLGLVACGVLIALGIGRSFEEGAEPERATAGADDGDARTRTRRSYALRALIPPALLIFYVVAVEPLGFVPTAAAMVFVLSLTFGANLRLAVPLAVVGPVIIHLAFYKLLRVPLPAGLLPMPWS